MHSHVNSSIALCMAVLPIVGLSTPAPVMTSWKSDPSRLFNQLRFLER